MLMGRSRPTTTTASVKVPGRLLTITLTLQCDVGRFRQVEPRTTTSDPQAEAALAPARARVGLSPDARTPK